MARRAIALFFVKIVIIYGLLILPWLHGPELYGWTFRKAGTVLFRHFGNAGRVFFGPMEPRKPPYDTTVTITNLGKLLKGPDGNPMPVRGSFDVDTRNMGYLATAFAFALIVSSPVPWRRRVVAAILGVAIMSAFVWLQMYLRLVNAFAEPAMGAMFDLSPFSRRALNVSITLLSRNPVTAYVFPLFIWAALTIRRRDLQRLGLLPADEVSSGNTTGPRGRRGR